MGRWKTIRTGTDTGAVLAAIARYKGIPTEPAADVWQTAGEHVAARGGVLQPWAELAALPNPGPLDPDDDLVVADRAAAAIATAGIVTAGVDGIRPWYCSLDQCDGRPHDRWTWSHARTDQRPPRGPWTCWVQLSGRGAGKTRSGSEYLTVLAREPGVRLAAIGPTADSLRAVMVEGESGLLACQHADNRADYQPALRKISYANGSTVALYSSEEPDRLRGPQEEAAWADEAAYFPRARSVFDNLLLGLRIGRWPRYILTTTPKASRWLPELLADPSTVVTTASTYSNLDNLAPTFAAQILSRYEGTLLGRQELHGELVLEAEGALFDVDVLDSHRLRSDVDAIPHIGGIVLGVDPAGRGAKTSDETGIVAVGRSVDELGHPVALVLADHSGRYRADQWAALVVRLAEEYQDAYGGSVVVRLETSGSHPEALTELVRNAGLGTVPLQEVRVGTSKATRAGHLRQHLEARRCWFVDFLPDLEQQMLTWSPDQTGYSPDRLDALVHGVEGVVGPLSTIHSAAHLSLRRTA